MAGMNDTPAPAARKSSGKGCLAGMGCGCLAILLLAGLGAWFAWHEFNTVMTRFEREGYRRVQGQAIEVGERITEPTIFFGETVRIKGGSDRGIALICKDAEIEGQVAGNVHFYGKTLTVKKNAELMRDLTAHAKTVNVYGIVRGQITGGYQTLNRQLPQEE